MADPEIMRRDRFIRSEPGIDIFVREVGPRSGGTRMPLVLVHGGGPGGLASFDLPVPGYSLAAELAADGRSVFVMDVRGWGGSSRPAALDEPPERNPPQVNSVEAARDVAAVVDAVRRERDTPVALLGWATGGHWGAVATAQHPDAVAALIVLNSLYSVDAPWGMREAFEDPDRPGVFDDAIGAYTWRSAASLLGGWDRSIPLAAKDDWRDPRVGEAYVAEALASDPFSASHDPPAMRVPTGFQRDSYALSRGRRFWDAGGIRARCLIVRGERDFWSRPVDLEFLAEELRNAADVRTLTIPDATHYLFNDRPQRGRRAFVDAVRDFLTG